MGFALNFHSEEERFCLAVSMRCDIDFILLFWRMRKMGGSYPKNPPLNPQVRIVVVFAELRCCRGTRAGYVGFNAAAPAQPRTYVISSSGGGAPWAPRIIIPPFVVASCLFFLALRSARFWTTASPHSVPSLLFFPRPNVFHQGSSGHVYSCAFRFGSSYCGLSFGFWMWS